MMCSPYHTNVQFTQSHAHVTVRITLKTLMTVRFFFGISVLASIPVWMGICDRR